MVSSESSISKASWAQVRDSIHHVCPELGKIIDDIEPDNKQSFISVKFPFGANIVSNGCLNLPISPNKLLPITDADLPEAIRSELNYSLVPLGIITKNTIEVYRKLDDRVFSIAAWAKGLDIGVWEYFGWTTPYNVSAGARSLYMIPRITLSSAHKRLKRDFGVTLPSPKQACDHWDLFKQIANSANFNNPWSCDVVFFSKCWVEQLKKYASDTTSPWYLLQNYLIKKNLDHSVYGRRRSIFEVVWQLFSRSLNNKGLKPNPYVMDTLKHITFVATGGSPGSSPNIGGTALGPISDIQLAYLNSYGLKEYVPTIMEPQYFNLENSTPVYYSLQSPTLLESVPNSRNLTSIIDNVRELMELSHHFLGEAFDDHLKISNTSINSMISKLKFEFFHENSYAYGENIRPSHEMPAADPNLIYMPVKGINRRFADTSSWLHGCVRIYS